MKKIILIALCACVTLNFYGYDLLCSKTHIYSSRDIEPIAHNNDTVLVRAKIKHEHFKDSIWIFDCVVHPYLLSKVKGNEISRDSMENIIKKDIDIIADRLNNKTVELRTILDNFYKDLNKKAPYGYVEDYDFYMNSAGCLEPTVKYHNTSNQTIKYISFTFSFKNPVGDTCYDTIRGGSLLTVEGIGPVEPNERGTWNFDSSFYNKGAETIILKKIVIRYMNGRSVTLAKDIKYFDDVAPAFKNLVQQQEYVNDKY